MFGTCAHFFIQQLRESSSVEHRKRVPNECKAAAREVNETDGNRVEELRRMLFVTPDISPALYQLIACAG